MARKKVSSGIWPAFVDLFSALSLIIMILFIAQTEKFKQIYHHYDRIEALLVDLEKTKKENEDLKKTLKEKNKIIQNLEDKINELEKERGVNVTIVEEFKEELFNNQIHATIDAQKNIEIDTSTFFDTNQYQIPTRAQENALKIGRAVYKLLNDKEKSAYISTVLVTGHTDHIGQDDDNMILSTNRASAFVNLWNNILLGDKCVKGKIIASGIGRWRPKIDQLVAGQGIKENRRIEIRIVPKSQSAKEIDGCP
jgi:outer membrane protein OmpA-like peptidoglycan-associated protein